MEGTRTKTYCCRSAVGKVISCGSMRQFQECILLGIDRSVASFSGEIWLLGACYKMSSEVSCGSSAQVDGQVGFLSDFSSKIWMTCRKGFDAISDSTLTSDVGRGCMIQSSQMLVAQALLFHHLGRAWRKPSQKPYEPEYVELLHLFGNSITSAFSRHNLLEAGDRDGECGGAPALCVDVVSRLCSEFCQGESTWELVLLLISLVLGLDKVSTRSYMVLQPPLQELIKWC